MLWAIRRNALNYLELRVWVPDDVIGWRPQVAVILAASIDGACALLPARARLEHADTECVWFSERPRRA